MPVLCGVSGVWQEVWRIFAWWLKEEMQSGMVGVGLQMPQQVCVCVWLQQQSWLTVNGSCGTKDSRVTHCQTGSRTETWAEAWAHPPRTGPVLALNPGPLAGQRRGRERTPSRWGYALSMGYTGMELVLNLQKDRIIVCQFTPGINMWISLPSSI